MPTHYTEIARTPSGLYRDNATGATIASLRGMAAGDTIAMLSGKTRTIIDVADLGGINTRLSGYVRVAFTE